MPRLLLVVGLAAGKCTPPEPDCESPPAAVAARSPKSPLDLFSALDGGPLLRWSPRRSWDSRRVGLGAIVDDALAAAGANTHCVLEHQTRRPSFKLPLILATSSSSRASEPRDCARRPPGLANLGATAGVVPVPCSSWSYGDLKSGPEPVAVPVPRGAQLGAGSLSAGVLPKVPTPASLPGRWYLGSVSATEVEQSEDYTCVIARGPNPRTTRIFGDCILEPVVTARVPDDDTDCVEKAAAESYWLVKCFGGETEDSCVCCEEKKLDGNDGCVCRGGDAFCTANCRDQEIPDEEEEEEEKSTPKSSSSSSGSSSSSFSDDTFMVALVGLVDTQLP